MKDTTNFKKVSTGTGVVIPTAETLTDKASYQIYRSGTSLYWYNGSSDIALSGTSAVTATANGLTTGLISSGTSMVIVTCDDANKIVTLPAAVVGHVIRLYVGANGCEVRTPASSNNTINNVDSDGTNEAAIPATTLCTFTCIAANAWILEAVDELGAVITAIVPDAA